MKSADAFFYNVCRRIVFRSDGSLTWFGWLCLLGAGILAAAVLSMFQGCGNRTPQPVMSSQENDGPDFLDADNPYALVWRDELVEETANFYRCLEEKENEKCRVNQE